MTEAATERRSTTNGAVSHEQTNGSDDGSSGSLAGMLPTDRLKEAAQALIKAATDRAVSAALDQVEGLSGRLGDVAENGGVGLTKALRGGDDSDDDSEDGDDDSSGGGIGGAIKSGFSTIKDKVTGALGIGGGGDSDSEGSGGGGGGGSAAARGKFKFMNIYETQDVGVPIRVAYDQWTQFADFPSFMKKIEVVNQEEDEKINWTAKVFWSRRSWETTIVEQVPDSHILWISTGAKGRADGFVAFGEIAPNMTKIVLILEYYPHGFFEKTGNLWRAVGRRARLEFKHFCRHVMMDSLVNRDDLEGWRGEIRDSEVVKTHEEALEEERAEAEDAEGWDELDDDLAEEGADDEVDGEEADEEFVAEDDAPEDDAADELADDELAEDELVEDEDDLDDVADEGADDQGADDEGADDEGADAAEGDEEPRPRRRRRTQPA